MDGKKISFGFKKTKKAEIPINAVEEEKKEFIECMEEKSIKIVGGETVKENQLLVIPMKPNTLITADKLKQIAEKVESALNEPEIKQEPVNDDKLPENATLEQMAVSELLQDAKKVVKIESDTLSIPTPAKPVMEGEKESTLDDYEAVPVQQFGMAMLRGMGWTPDKDGSKYKQPELRPKGLGLGADKVIKENQKKKSSKDSKDEELSIVTNSFVKITTGKYSGYYGKVVSLDEDNGRVMVDIPIKKETVSLNEFMMHAVTKTEYDKESKVINADSFEEYKKNERVTLTSSKEDERGSSSQRNKESYNKNARDRNNEDSWRQKDNENSSNGRSRMRERDKRCSSSSEDRPSRRKKKDKKRYSSSDSVGSLSDSDKKRKKHKSKKRQSSSASSDSRDKSPPKGKRDIDKKRKGKKKKRDRDRSPNYKKHRK